MTATIAQLVAASRLAQGLPRRVEEEAVLRRLAALVARTAVQS